MKVFGSTCLGIVWLLLIAASGGPISSPALRGKIVSSQSILSTRPPSNRCLPLSVLSPNARRRLRLYSSLVSWQQRAAIRRSALVHRLRKSRSRSLPHSFQSSSLSRCLILGLLWAHYCVPAVGNLDRDLDRPWAFRGGRESEILSGFLVLKTLYSHVQLDFQSRAHVGASRKLHFNRLGRLYRLACALQQYLLQANRQKQACVTCKLGRLQ